MAHEPGLSRVGERIGGTPAADVEVVSVTTRVLLDPPEVGCAELYTDRRVGIEYVEIIRAGPALRLRHEGRLLDRNGRPKPTSTLDIRWIDPDGAARIAERLTKAGLL